MQDGYLITLSDDEGNNFELEVVGEVEYGDDTYVVFLPADMDESNEEYGYIILRSIDSGNGEETFDSVDDEELLEKIYAIFIEKLENEEAASQDDGE